jgi:hypothetical protein
MLALALCAVSVAPPVPQPSAAQIAAAGLGRLPVAPASQRVDLVAPPFTDSTAVTNPLFPIARLQSAILNGSEDREPLKIETTLLPDARVMEWSPGQCVKTLVSQFVAYRGGRIEEVALDRIPGLVFEQVTVKHVGKTVAGPFGPVAGAIVAGELHDDGTREDKTFAPGYGEFRSEVDARLLDLRAADALRAAARAARALRAALRGP